MNFECKIPTNDVTVDYHLCLFMLVVRQRELNLKDVKVAVSGVFFSFDLACSFKSKHLIKWWTVVYMKHFRNIN
jgi:hypothetical protein